MTAAELASTIHSLLNMVASSTNDKRRAGLVNMESVMDDFDNLCTDDFNNVQVREPIMILNEDQDGESYVVDVVLADRETVLTIKCSKNTVEALGLELTEETQS